MDTVRTVATQEPLQVTRQPPRQAGLNAWSGRLAVAGFAALLSACGGGGEGGDAATALESSAAALGADAAAEAAWTGIRQDGALGRARDWAYAVATDAQGNVVIGGGTQGVFSGKPVITRNAPFIAKYGADGRRQWATLVVPHDRLGGADAVYGVATDRAGNIYAAGLSNTAFPGQTVERDGDVFLTKYSPDGVRLWGRQFGSDRLDVAYAVAVDAQGHATIAGQTYGVLPQQPASTEGLIFVARFDTHGNRQWIRQWGAGFSNSGHELARGVALDAAGNAYVAGTIHKDYAGTDDRNGPDAFMAKYDTSGQRLWFSRLGSQSHDRGNAVAVSTDGGTIYLVGRTNGDFSRPGYPPQPIPCCAHPDAFVMRLNGNGRIRWARNLSAVPTSEPRPRHFFDEATGVVTNALGSVAFITGTTLGAMPGQTWQQGSDVFVARYDAEGRRAWVRQFGSRLPARNQNDQASGIARDPEGEVFVSGTTVGTFGTPGKNSDLEDWFVLKLSPAGGLR